MLLGQLDFNMLRIIDQQGLQTGLIKRKRKVRRIRLRKVLQDISEQLKKDILMKIREE